MKITKKLENMLAKASKKLEEAQDARSEVMDYLEEHYGIDSDKVRELIEKAKSE